MGDAKVQGRRMLGVFQEQQSLEANVAEAEKAEWETGLRREGREGRRDGGKRKWREGRERKWNTSS